MRRFCDKKFTELKKHIDDGLEKNLAEVKKITEMNAERQISVSEEQASAGVYLARALAFNGFVYGMNIFKSNATILEAKVPKNLGSIEGDAFVNMLI
ncbi:hypothetical protein ISN45_Aa03g017080 [Arabidopsis thaliana x Arabidopsis arenosa]|uniref:Uncharacterized protein n=1 Tax=Arabidopsis thaliana x Arabidopsis arenosa TaxID=1240361 RepID=A0A8T2ATG9_9BRAS|nr:hypothetical protein ISN45_Aa03g017080 [Arabidopsis thaliana x Arabidopsis arenosa]